MIEFVPVIEEAELPIGKSAVIALGGEDIALFNYKGKYYAIANKCLHQGSSLADGRIEEGVVLCPNHEWRFNLTSGQCPQNPEMRAKVYPVRAVKGKVCIGVEIKDAKKAAPGRTPESLPPALKFKIPTIQKPRNPDEEL